MDPRSSAVADGGSSGARASAPKRTPARNVCGLSPLEIASGLLHGVDPAAPDCAQVTPATTPLVALEDALRPALEAAPCFVAFSGGRDSSALLAVATRVSRREGLPPPIALTLRWPDVPATDEHGWQQRVIQHLGVPQREWLVIEVREDLDLLGPVATSMLRRHGLLWPPSAIGVVPLLQAASGGTLVLGDGGDQVLGDWRWSRLGSLFARRRRPRPRDVLSAGLALSPRVVRRSFDGRRRPPHQTWLRPAVYRRYARLAADDMASEPLRWDEFLRWTSRHRQTTAMAATWERLADDVGARLSMPFWDLGFLATMARAGGHTGLGGRTSVMRAVFPEVLPDDVLARGTKANFTTAYWSGHSRVFARDWDGSGVDPELVDLEQLRAVWCSELPTYGSATLLHAAWLATELGEGA